MAAERLHLFPGMIFSPFDWSFDPEKKAKYKTDFVFGKALAGNYSHLISSGQLPDYVLAEATEFRKLFQNSSGETVQDFAIVYGPEQENTSQKNDVEVAYELVRYFSNYKMLYFRPNLDCLTINFSSGIALRHSFSGFKNVHSFNFKYSFSGIGGQQSRCNINQTDESIISITQNLIRLQNDLGDRLVNSISFFNEACRSEAANEGVSVILLVTALESILQIPRHAKADGFTYGIQTHFGFSKEIGEWAKSLYELRNSLVHGQPTEKDALFVSKEFKHANHSEIASEIFDACVLFVLSNCGFLQVNQEYKFHKIQIILSKIRLNSHKINLILKKKSELNYKSLIKSPPHIKSLIDILRSLAPRDSSGNEKYQALFILLFDIYWAWFQDYKLIQMPDHMKHLQAGHVQECESIRVEIIQIKDYLRKEYKPHKFKEFKETLSKFQKLVNGNGSFSGFEPVSPQSFQWFVENTIRPICDMYWYFTINLSVKKKSAKK